MPRNPAALAKLSRAGKVASRLDGAVNPAGTGTPNPPGFLSPDALTIWHNVLPAMLPGGYLRAQDSILLGQLCEVIAALQADPPPEYPVPLRKLVLEYTDRLGLSPRARCGIDIPEPRLDVFAGLDDEDD